MFATQVLSKTLCDDDSAEENTLKTVGLIVINDKKYEVKKGETKIGRDSSLSSVVIENATVSKVHAVIESEGVDDTFIYDVGSTNQTKLGKKVLKPLCRYKLYNNSKITLGNVVAEFLYFSHKNSNSVLKKESFDSDYNALDELGDIFDVATQVNVHQLRSSNKIPAFEKSENIHTLKTPNTIIIENVKQSSASSSKGCLNEFELNLQGTFLKADYCNAPLENSGIFSLNTQCQIYEPVVLPDSKCGNKMIDNDHKSSESDKIKISLNDEQDDVLSTFLTLCSPQEQSNHELFNEIKVKTVTKNFEHVLDGSAQAQVEIIQKTDKENKAEKNDVLQNKNLSETFSASSYKSSITSTPLCRNIQLNCLSDISKNIDNCTQHIEDEDFIKTQEFKADGLKSTIEEFKNSDEDFILTQVFEVVENNHQNKKITTVIPESEDWNASDEDITETQVYDVEKVKEKISTEARSSFLERSESLHKKIESHLTKSLVYTEKNNQDDLIATQAFKITCDVKRASENSERSDNDDDFIATQPVESLKNKTLKNKNCQETARKEKIYTRKGVLGSNSESSCKKSENCIKIQTFQIPENEKLKRSPEFLGKSNSITSNCFKKEKDSSDAQTKVLETLYSSDDETESDLEIILDKNETGKKKQSQEHSQKNINIESDNYNGVRAESSTAQKNNSYIFEFKLENPSAQNQTITEQKYRSAADLSDSDATDCEEFAMVSSETKIKEEPSREAEFEETQVLTLSLPHDFATVSEQDNDCISGEESPRFEIEHSNGSWSPLSLEMPNTQDIEATLRRVLRNENENTVEDRRKNEDFQTPSKKKRNEVGLSNLDENATLYKQVISPLKRPLDINSIEKEYVKKSKTATLDRLLKSTEKQFSKLVQAHDISQIRPSRTRNSLKMLQAGSKTIQTNIPVESNIINERQTSRRKTNRKKRNNNKLNCDIMPFLKNQKREIKRKSFDGEKKNEISPKQKGGEERTRILRSSGRQKGNLDPTTLIESPVKNIPVRRSKRNLSFINEKYLSNACISVVFTGFDCESLDKIISDLGGKKTNDISCAEVVVADKVRRTVKFLSAIGLSLPITSPEWLLSCKREGKFLNPWDFILKDEESEEKWDFILKTSLERSKKNKLLQGFSVFATKSTKPPVKDLLAIVEISGGTALFHPPDTWPKKTIIASCLEDKKWWPHAKRRNIQIVHYEFILSGILKQKIDFKTYKLR